MKESVELGELEQRLQIVVEVRKAKLSSLLADFLGERNQYAESRAVDVTGLTEVDQKFLFAALELIENLLLELLAITDDELTFHINDDHVILLPNNGNVILAAKEIAGLTSKKVHLIETHNVPQGVAAVVAFNPERNVDENVAAMRAEAERVQTIEVTHAVRDTRSNGLRVKKGDVIGLVNDRLEFTGNNYAEVVQKALGKLGPDDYELVTVYRGEDASDEELETLESSIRSSYPALEVEVQQGGQLHYPFILSVE